MKEEKPPKKSRQFQRVSENIIYETLASSSTLAHFALPHQPHHNRRKTVLRFLCTRSKDQDYN
jgi:hypothetical protein